MTLEQPSPRWVRDLERFLSMKSQFVLSANVRDLQVSTNGGIAVPLTLSAYLVGRLKERGYARVISFDPVAGFTIADGNMDRAANDKLLSDLGLQAVDGRSPAGVDLFAATLERIAQWSGEPIALIADFASRLIVRQDALSGPEHHAFTRALISSHKTRPRPYGEPRRPFYNTIIYVVEKEGDLPDWLVVDNPKIRHIPIPKPDNQVRQLLAEGLLKTLPGGRDADPAILAKSAREFVEGTNGLLLVDMVGIAELSKGEKVTIEHISDAVRRYKVGVTEDLWQKIDRAKIAGAERFIRERVKGQDHATRFILDIVKRAVTGVGRSRRGGRPRGIAFLAGPTGVGKTELAKTVTSLLFGDESAYIRFDMSEFSAEHADQRLIGAPPGYVGYDVGGELTNAIREKPFSVVLFDEIEKAHPRILDKFLQILDDGVLTSGRGDRVYFSEAFIIFTSNLGIYRVDANGDRVLNVFPSEDYEHVRTKVRDEIDRHFKVTLNRPEILNRIGDNVIVFDFIRPNVATDIFSDMVNATLADVRGTQQVEIKISDTAIQKLQALCLADLTNGGRGIRNKVETHLINPLSRAMFEKGQNTRSFEIFDVETDLGTSLVLKEPG
jgi:AAA domain (Cdc48 subfamily)